MNQSELVILVALSVMVSGCTGSAAAATLDSSVAISHAGTSAASQTAHDGRVGTAVSEGTLAALVVDEIELMMTPTQLQAIADLEITQQSADDVLAQAAPPPEATGSTAAATPAPFASAIIAYLQRVAHAWPRLRVGQPAMRLSDYRSR